MDKKMSLMIKGANYFWIWILPLSLNLMMWIFSSDLQLVGVLIDKYNLSNDRIRNSNQLKSCIPLSLLSRSSWIIRFEFRYRKLWLKYWNVTGQIWVKITSSLPLIFSLSIYLFGLDSVFNVILSWSLTLTTWFTKN